jgi:hypothetical protein
LSSSTDERVIKACFKLGCAYLGDTGTVVDHDNSEASDGSPVNSLPKAVKYLHRAAVMPGKLPEPNIDDTTGLPVPLPRASLQGDIVLFVLCCLRCCATQSCQAKTCFPSYM